MLVSVHHTTRNAGVCTPYYKKCWYLYTILQEMLVSAHHTTRNAGICTPYYKKCWYLHTILQEMLVSAHHTTRNAGICTPYYKECWYLHTILHIQQDQNANIHRFGRKRDVSVSISECVLCTLHHTACYVTWQI